MNDRSVIDKSAYTNLLSQISACVCAAILALSPTVVGISLRQNGDREFLLFDNQQTVGDTEFYFKVRV